MAQNVSSGYSLEKCICPRKLHAHTLAVCLRYTPQMLVTSIRIVSTYPQIVEQAATFASCEGHLPSMSEGGVEVKASQCRRSPPRHL